MARHFTATSVYNNLAQASYAVNVRDANSCDYTTTATPIAIWSAQQLVAPVDAVWRQSFNGFVTLGAVTGGTAPYTYSFDGSWPITTTTSYHNGLAAGTHDVEIVTDANNW